MTQDESREPEETLAWARGEMVDELNRFLGSEEFSRLARRSARVTKAIDGGGMAPTQEKAWALETVARDLRGDV